ncbi:MAG: anthranilate synthase component I [SAR116 cluster bacterium]|nr:anthranilate synthase component I [SAR116 cluster bacterium]
MNDISKKFIECYNSGKPQLLWKFIVADLETPVSALIKLTKNRNYNFLLESVEGGENRGRYSAIGINPDLIWRCKNGLSETAIPKNNNVKFVKNKEQPLNSLRSLINDSTIEIPKNLPPLSAGLFGYIGYDMISYFENIKIKNSDPLNLPETILIRPSLICIFDRLKDEFILITPIRPTSNLTAQEAWENGQKIITNAVGELNMGLDHSNLPVQKELKQDNNAPSNLKKSEFFNSVEKAKEYIKSGDVYQVVLSQRFEVPFKKSSISFYRSLRRLNPSPFLFHFNFGDFFVVGSSPEILVRLRNNECTIRPIAGTRPRGNNKEEDSRLKNELLEDPKERAEHLMLLDLGRNDVGRVSKPGTVEVSESFSVEMYSHVMHIESEVKGELRNELDSLDALIAGFPAGTVSGAPKIRAMEIIEELETERRGIYSGAVGYFSAAGDLDTCIALRTGIIKDEKLYVQAGGGIVHDSTNEGEELETRNKAKALIRAAELAE